MVREGCYTDEVEFIVVYDADGPHRKVLDMGLGLAVVIKKANFVKALGWDKIKIERL